MNCSTDALARSTSILTSLQHSHRVSNEKAKNVPLLYPQGVFLPLHVCYMIGYRNGKKSVETIVLLKQKKGKHVHYYVSWYPSGLAKPCVSFWVYTGAALKNKVFAFTDRVSFMRATFVDLPGIGLIRLSYLPHLRLPESSVTRCVCVYSAHQKAPLFFSSDSTPLDGKSDKEKGQEEFFSIPAWQQQCVTTQQSLRFLHRALHQGGNPEEQKQALKMLLVQLLNSL